MQSEIDHEIVEAQLLTLRNRLLDFTPRNDLLNHSHSQRSTNFVRVVDELPNELYEKLVNGQMEFKPLPDIESEPPDEKTPDFLSYLEVEKLTNEDYQKKISELGNGLFDEQNLQEIERDLRDNVREALDLPPLKKGKNIDLREHAKIHGFDPNYELPFPRDELSSEHTDNFIQTLFIPEGLDRRLRSLYSKKQQFLSETGINVLQAAFGFLEWYEEKNSDRALYAPLLLLPLSMERAASRSGASFKLFSGGEGAELNQTLVEKLKTMDILLPDFEEDDTPELYFEKVNPLIEKKSKWQLKRFVTIGIFPFQKITMYNDLAPEKWPNNSLLENKILATLLRGLESGLSLGSALDEYDIDELSVRGEAPPLFLDADSSQHSAIMDVLEGKNLVIQGPPGTGKSQTIANIIAAAMSQNKSVLFVAEKQAALNVVASRLRSVGLGPCLLDLHKRNDRQGMFEAIQENIDARDLKIQLSNKNGKGVLKYHLEKMKKHKSLLHEPTGFGNLKGYELLWKYIHLKDESQNIFIPGEFSFVAQPITQAQLENNIGHIQNKLDDNVPQNVRRKADELREAIKVANPVVIQDIQAKANSLVAVIGKVISFFGENKKILDTIFYGDDTVYCFQTIEDLKKLSSRLIGIEPRFASSLEASNEILNGSFLQSLEEYARRLGQISELKEEIPSSIMFAEIIEDYSVRELKELYQQLSKKGVASWFSSELKKAKDKAEILGLDLTKPDRDRNTLAKLIELIEHVNFIERETVKWDSLDFINGENTSVKDLHNFIKYVRVAEEIEKENSHNSHQNRFNRKLFCSVPAITFLTQDLGEIFDDTFLTNLLDLTVSFCASINFSEEAMIIDFFKLNNFANLISETSNSDLIEIAKINSVGTVALWPNLSKFMESERINKMSSKDASTLYEFLEVEAQTRAFTDKDPKIWSEVSGRELSELKRKFNTNDRILMKEHSENVLDSTLKTNIPRGNSKGKKSTFSEFSLIKHEMSLKRSRLSIRKLVRRASKALKAMKPVWMLSPLAVSQFLSKEPGQFDVLIIDEASQMKPEDALPAILRAKQLVVVGDNKQLPPTSFFDVSMEATDADEDDDVQQESILDLAADRLADTRTLRWHYRSRHPDLIRFSNKRFYDNKLLVFPSPFPEAQEMGVKYVEVQGIYNKSLNEKEAQRVVEEAITQMTNFPDKSLAIVAANVKQKEFIREAFEKQLTQNDAVRDYVESWKDHDLEPFIIRNLESIQGDERDVIIVSTVYGPNEEGNVRQDFGPINRHYGPRRLNVLFSRAKEKLILVTSLKPNDIKLDATQNQSGKAALKEYINFASTGVLYSGEKLEREPDSDFEIAVIDRLTQHGFEAEPQVGVEGFRIDIGVKHPDFPYGFIAGVECDGATYHSSRSARDRDKIRQDLLENLGWKIYRIWSTDWFLNPEKETQKLLEQLEFYKEAALSRIRGQRIGRDEDKNLEKNDNKIIKSSPQKKAAKETTFTQNITDKASKSSEPFGRRRELEHNGNTIVFYEDNAEFFEVWEDKKLIGEIEKQGSVSQKAVIFGGSIKGIQKPRYQCHLLEPVEVTKTFDDIFVSLRWIYDNYKERVIE